MSGGAKVVMMASFPEAASVTVEVSTSRESEVRKKRSAGRAASLGVARAAAMANPLIVAPVARGRNEAGRKDNSQLGFGAEAAAASAARATLRVRLDTGRPEISASGSSFRAFVPGKLFALVVTRWG